MFMSHSDHLLLLKNFGLINFNLWWIWYPTFKLMSMASATCVSRTVTRWRISSARSEVVGCQLKLGLDGVSSCSWGAAGKLGGDYPALLILQKVSGQSCLPQLAIKFCFGAWMTLPKWYGGCLNIKAITVARKWTLPWTVDVLTRSTAKSAAAVAGDIPAAEMWLRCPSKMMSGMENWNRH